MIARLVQRRQAAPGQGRAPRTPAAGTRNSRKAFGLTWNEVVEAGPAVGDEVAIALDLEVVKEQPKTAAK